MPTYTNTSDEVIVIGGMTFQVDEEKETSRYFREKPTLLELSDDEPYVTPITVLLSGTSFPTEDVEVLVYPALYIHNKTNGVASIEFNNDDDNILTIPAADKLIVRNDETINSLLVSAAGTGTVSVYGLRNKNTIEV